MNYDQMIMKLKNETVFGGGVFIFRKEVNRFIQAPYLSFYIGIVILTKTPLFLS